MVCRNCNKYNKYGADICAFCGAKLESDVAFANENSDKEVELKSFVGASMKENICNIKSETEKVQAREKIHFEPIDKYEIGKTRIIRKDVAFKQENETAQKNDFEMAFNEKTDDCIGEDISFENEFELNDMSLDFSGKKEKSMTIEEKITLRNTALIAVILAIVIDVALVVGMLVYFKSFANKIVNVSQYQIQQTAETRNLFTV